MICEFRMLDILYQVLRRIVEYSSKSEVIVLIC